MLKWILISTFAYAMQAKACQTNAMKVYYIDLGKRFFVPPVPVEKHAEKVVNIKDCKLDELFKAAAAAETVGDADERKARIKIINGSGEKAQTLFIDDSKQVVWFDKVVKIDDHQVDDIISLIKSKPASKKKR